MKRTKFENGDLVMILIPEPNVTNYRFHHYNYQLGIVIDDRKHIAGEIYSYPILMDFAKGLFIEHRHIVGMYEDHLILISKHEFKNE